MTCTEIHVCVNYFSEAERGAVCWEPFPDQYVPSAWAPAWRVTLGLSQHHFLHMWSAQQFRGSNEKMSMQVNGETPSKHLFSLLLKDPGRWAPAEIIFLEYFSGWCIPPLALLWLPGIWGRYISTVGNGQEQMYNTKALPFRKFWGSKSHENWHFLVCHHSYL